MMLYFGLASLIPASVWNAWPRKAGASCSNNACAVQESTIEQS